MENQVAYKLVYVIGSDGLGSSDVYSCTEYDIGIPSYEASQDLFKSW